MADEDDRKWLPPTNPDDEKTGDTLPGVPGSFSGGPDVPGSEPSSGGLSSGDPLGGTPGPPSGSGGWGPPPQQPESQWGPPQPPSGQWGQQTLPPYQQQTAGTNNKATAALVLGIIGLVLCPLICSVLALIFGYQARGEIDRSGGREGGRGMATAGIVTGWIGIAFSVLGIVLVVAGAISLDDSDSSDDFDDFSLVTTTVARALALLPL